MDKQNNLSLFDSCTTESDVMKRMFELSATNNYSRNELVHLANIKRAELQSSLSSEVELIKIVIPENEGQRVNEVAKSLISFSENPKVSSNFEFLGNGKVRF